MNCKSCGKEIPDDSKFCFYCGGKVEANTAPQFNNFNTDRQPAFAGQTVSNQPQGGFQAQPLQPQAQPQAQSGFQAQPLQQQAQGGFKAQPQGGFQAQTQAQGGFQTQPSQQQAPTQAFQPQAQSFQQHTQATLQMQASNAQSHSAAPAVMHTGADRVKFEGKGSKLFWKLVVVYLLSLITFGIYGPWGFIKIKKFVLQNTIIDGKRFDFIGTGGSLWGQILLMGILSSITIGIYAPWGYCKLQRWIAKNTLVID